MKNLSRDKLNVFWGQLLGNDTIHVYLGSEIESTSNNGNPIPESFWNRQAFTETEYNALSDDVKAKYLWTKITESKC